MNCENFNDQLPEYLDGTLADGEQAAAREHVEKCVGCQRALAWQEAFAKTLRLSMNRQTQGLSLRPEMRRNIKKATEARAPLPTVLESIRAFFAFNWRRPAWAGAAMLGLLLLVFGNYFYQHPAKDFVQRIADKGDRYTYVINIPIQTETHVDRNQNNMTVDALVTGDSVIDLSFAEDNKRSTRSN